MPGSKKLGAKAVAAKSKQLQETGEIPLEVLNSPEYQAVIKRKKLIVNLIFVGASFLITILIISLIVISRGGGKKPVKKRNAAKIATVEVKAVGLNVKAPGSDTADAAAKRDDEAAEEAAALAKEKARNADRLQRIVTENRELLDKALPEDAEAARSLLDEKIRFLESIGREFEDQLETQLYQGLKKEKERLQGIRAMYEE